MIEFIVAHVQICTFSFKWILPGPPALFIWSSRLFETSFRAAFFSSTYFYNQLLESELVQNGISLVFTFFLHLFCVVAASIITRIYIVIVLNSLSLVFAASRIDFCCPSVCVETWVFRSSTCRISKLWGQSRRSSFEVLPVHSPSSLRNQRSLLRFDILLSHLANLAKFLACFPMQSVMLHLLDFHYRFAKENFGTTIITLVKWIHASFVILWFAQSALQENALERNAHHS